MKFKNIFPFWFAILTGCLSKFVDTTVQGVPNMEQIAPNLWRLGQPTNNAAWDYVRTKVSSGNTPVLVVKLNDDNEGSDDYVSSFMNWKLAKTPIPPEDDKPWTVFVKPDASEVTSIVKLIVQAHQNGWIVLFHCTHGRDRTGMIAALVGRQLFGWSKAKAWSDMMQHGFRWELPDLDAFWIEDVSAKPLKL